jgi:hypothetical protein
MIDESGAPASRPAGVDAGAPLLTVNIRDIIISLRNASYREFFGQYSPGVRIGLALGAVFYAACFVIAFVMDRWWLNVLLCFFGGALGWFLGILGTPTSSKESEAFLAYRRALSAFVGGYLLARVDVFIGRFDIQRAGDPYLLLARGLLAITTFLLCLQFTFVTRVTNGPASDQPPDHERDHRGDRRGNPDHPLRRPQQWVVK